jgi:arylsulfatase A-like enzyme
MKLSQITVLLLISTVLIFNSCNSSQKDSDEGEGGKLPNIVLILSDDQAWYDYSFMGHEFIQTPNIDRLANAGVTFTQGYVPASLCRPSLASLVTGLYPHQHKVLGNDPVFDWGESPKHREEWLIKRAEANKEVIGYFAQFDALPELLREKDYLSFQTGKWWEGHPENGGFDYSMTHADPARGGRHGDIGLEIGRRGMDTIYQFIDLAMEEEKPFFLWYAPFLPHTPHNPPDSLLQKYLPYAPTRAIAAYWANCEWFDITCGQLIDFIDKKGVSDNTLFIYVCDNGWVQDPERSNRYAEPSKRSPYNTGVRTPVMFAWEGVIDPEMDTMSIVSSIDIVPTILEITGIEKPQNLHGIDVLNDELLKPRESVFGEIYDHDFSTIDSSLQYRLAITNPYKLILPDKNNRPDEEVQLFNIIEDPYETQNLAEQLPVVTADLQDRIKEFWRGTGQ